MSLQTQYRPKSFKTFVGNEDIVSNLKTMLDRENPPDAFLFTGPGGTGKTTLARIVKKVLGCHNTDFKELNAADDRGIDGIRKLITDMKFTPYGKRKVFLLDEAHMLTKPAQEALLKSLEEPPSYMHWIVCTTNPEALKSTFKRRCHSYELESLKDSDAQKLMRMILKKEKRDEEVTMNVRSVITELADGSAGQALKLLDMVIDMDDEERALNTLKSAGTTDEESKTIVKILTSYNMPQKTKWLRIKKVMKEYKGDGESARRPILGYFNSILLNNGGDETFFAMQPFTKNFYDTGKAGLTMACYESIFGGDE